MIKNITRELKRETDNFIYKIGATRTGATRDKLLEHLSNYINKKYKMKGSRDILSRFVNSYLAGENCDYYIDTTPYFTNIKKSKVEEFKRELTPLDALDDLEDEIKWTHSDGKKLTGYDEARVKVIREALSNYEIIRRIVNGENKTN